MTVAIHGAIQGLAMCVRCKCCSIGFDGKCIGDCGSNGHTIDQLCGDCDAEGWVSVATGDCDDRIKRERCSACEGTGLKR